MSENKKTLNDNSAENKPTEQTTEKESLFDESLPCKVGFSDVVS